MYYKIRWVLSFLPGRFLKFMFNHWPLNDQTPIGWNIWIDAHLVKDERRDDWNG